MFDDIVAANRAYAESFRLAGLAATAARGLAVVTCIDSRIEPLQMLGLSPGDAKILRNAGGRVTHDVLRTLALATNLLGVHRICLVQHTDCRLLGATNHELQGSIGRLRHADASGWDFLPIDDHARTLGADAERIRTCPLIPPDTAVAGFVYDVATGGLDAVLPVSAGSATSTSRSPGRVT